MNAAVELRKCVASMLDISEVGRYEQDDQAASKDGK